MYTIIGQYFTIVKNHVASTKCAFGIIITVRFVNSTFFYCCLYHLKIIKKHYNFLSNILSNDQQAFISLIYQFRRVANDQSE